MKETHMRQEDHLETPHHRISDDVLLELLRLVQQLDTKLDNHIVDETEQFNQALNRFHEIVDKLVEEAFPDSNLPKHRKSHSGFWSFITSWWTK